MYIFNFAFKNKLLCVYSILVTYLKNQMLLLLVFILSFVCADPPSNLNNFNWSENAGYAITGNIRIIIEIGPYRVSDETGVCAIVVHDNYGILFELGPGGNFGVLLNDTTYNWNNRQFTGCAVVNGFGYSHEIAGYHFATSDDLFSSGNNIVYSGLVHDSNGCGRPIFITIRTHNNVIVWLKFIQAYVIATGANSSACGMVTGVMEMSYASRTFNESRIAAYFNTIPASCFGNATIDFCPFAYPANNPCDNVMTPFPSHKRRSVDA